MLAPRAFLTFALAAAAPGLGGCARTAEERHLDDMREEIDRIQRDRDRADQDQLYGDPGDRRPEGVSVTQRAPAPGQAAPPSSVGGGAEGESYEEVADPDDKSPRPVIRVTGGVRGRAGAREDSVQQALPDDSGYGGAPSRSSALDPQAKPAYDAAISLVNGRQYDRALDALAAFLVKWPDHPYADNAMYWRGECYFAKADYSRASEQFEGVVSRFPAGNKVPDALLKLGLCQQKLGNAANAKAWFDRLSQQFPRSDAARRIPVVTVPAATPPGPAPEEHR
jgi:tol-pal system protein YbgF